MQHIIIKIQYACVMLYPKSFNENLYSPQMVADNRKENLTNLN